MFKQSERNNCQRRTKHQMENVERSNESSFTDVQRTCQCGSGSCEGRLVTVGSIPTDLYLFGYSAVDIFFISSTITHYFLCKTCKSTLLCYQYCFSYFIQSNGITIKFVRETGRAKLIMSVTITPKWSG